MSDTPSETNHQLQPEKWIDRYSDYLFSFASIRLNRKDIAEDMVQETFLAAWNAKDNYQSNASEKTWLTSILKNKIVDHYRKSSTKNELNVLDKPSADGDSSYFFEKEGGYEGHWTVASGPQDWKKDLGNKVEAEEFQNILKECLSKLPERARGVFVMKIIEGEESEVICKELGITPSNFWILMHRAKLQLRECMQKNWANV
ncbi:MAG: sigma-70 family RNA polymerase sigma factor [Bacteroidota bacterium]